MNTTTTTAAAEAAKNLAIYKAVADHARHAFEYLDIKPGKYTPAQIVAELKNKRAAWKDSAPAVGDEAGLARVAVDSFACSFHLLNAFDLLAQLATAYDIPTRDRVTFERVAETAPAVVSFMVPTAAADVAKAVAKKAPEREALTFAYIDTDRRALVGTNGHVLTVAAVPSLQVAEGARRGYLVARGLLKADRVTIDTNNKATDGHNVAESPDWLRFPVWSSVFPDVYDTDAVAIDNTTRRALAKAVAAAAKYATPDTKDTRHVAIFGEAGTDRLTIRARREIAAPTAADPYAVKYEYMNTTVQLPATLSRSLAFAFHGPDFATLPAFDTLFITPNEGRPAVVISKRAAAVLVPQPLPDGYDRLCKTDERPAFAVQLHPLADLLDVFTDAPDTLTAAPADDSQDTPAEVISEDTTPAAAADDHQDNDPAAPAFAVGEAFELLTDTGATVAARVRSQYYNNDDTAAPCWIYCYDCDPWTDRHGVTIDGGSCDAARMKKAAAPADDSQDTPAEVISEPTRPDYMQEGRAVAFYSMDHAAWLVGVVADPRPISDEWIADFIFGSYRVVGVSARELTPARADRRELTAAELKNLRAVVASYKEGAPEVAPRVLSDLWERGLRVLGEFVVERATREAVARVVVTYGKKRRSLDCPCTGGRIELFKYPADLADTLTTTTAEPVSEPIEIESQDTTTAAPADDHQDTPAEVISEPTESEPTAAAPAADDHQSESEADALPVTFYDPAAGVIVWGLADELPTADGMTAESVTAADLLTIESERESAAPADGHQDTTTTAHDSESRPRALLLTMTRAALRLAAVVAALLLMTFASDRQTPATATTTPADLLAPADHQDTPADLMTISESESADTLTTTPAELLTISEPTESEPTARPAADLLTADTLTAARVVDPDSLTAEDISESQDTTTTARPLLTADELAELLALLTGTTTAADLLAPADHQDTPAELMVISESESQDTTTAAPAADDSQDTPATTGTTTTPAPAAGCPAAVATPCPPAAPVAPVAPIIL